MQLFNLDFLIRHAQRQAQPVPFDRAYDTTEAKAHYLKKKAKDEESVFLMTRKDPKGKNVIDYDMEAVQGYYEILWEEKNRKQEEIHNEIQRLIDQKNSMPSGAIHLQFSNITLKTQEFLNSLINLRINPNASSPDSIP